MSGTIVTAAQTLGLDAGPGGGVSIAPGGEILLSGSFASDEPLSLASAIYVTAPVGVTNAGILSASILMPSPSGAKAEGAGIRLQAAGSVSNLSGGTISGNAVGVALNAGGSLANAAGGVISGGQYGAVLGAGASARNGGFITGQGEAGAVLAGGAGLSNLAGGTVTGDFAGVLLRGAGIVVNAGSIASQPGGGRDGIAISGTGAQVENEAGGVISGYEGIFSSGTASIGNAGSIIGGAAQDLVQPFTGYMFGGGAGVVLADGTIQNTGAILGGGIPAYPFAHGGTAGAGVQLSSGYLLNAGNITGGSASGYSLTGGAGLAAGAASIVNQGTVTGGAAYYGGAGAALTGSYLVNAGSIQGGAGGGIGGTGVVLDGATLVNTGNISGGGGSSWSWSKGLAGGVELYSGLLLNTGTITGGPPQRVGLVQSWGEAFNAGLVTGNAAALLLGGSLTNDGTIAGNEVGVDVAGGTLTNAGTIAGPVAVYLGGGATMLAAEPGALFQGAVEDKGSLAGTLALEAGASSGMLDMGTSFSGFSTINFATGAAWLLEGGTAALAAGQTITGLAAADTLVLEGFSATSGDFQPGTGLVLSGADGAETLAIAGSFATQDFTITSSGAETDIVICYRRGTRILTAEGEKPVEELRRGDAVPTRFGGTRRIRWIGRQSFSAREIQGDRDRLPVHIRAGALAPHVPARDLFVSPGHSMLVGDVLVLAKALVNGITITQEDAGEGVDYFLPEFDAHDCLMAEGAWSESFADGPFLRKNFHNLDEFHGLYPGYAMPSFISLCAPRPENGPALETALAPIVARAGQLAMPGFLRGCIDVADGRCVEGWAQDMGWPELPQRLAFYEGKAKLGEALACQYRADLRVAGIGAGRAAFSFAAPRPFDPARLRVCRVGDGVEIFVSPAQAA